VITLKLTHDEPRLVFLALVYHLGRPGSELDPRTKQPVARGLREVKLALGRDLGAPSALIDLDEGQYQKLLSAIYGSATELRGYHMRNGAASTVARFTETARSLFPQITDDPEAALDIAEALVLLHRRIERAVRAAEADANATGRGERGSARRWPFGARGGGRP